MFKVGSKVRLKPLQQLKLEEVIVRADGSHIDLIRGFMIRLGQYSELLATPIHTIQHIEEDEDYEGEFIYFLEVLPNQVFPVECFMSINTMSTRRNPIKIKETK